MTLKMEIDALGRSCLLALALGCSGISAAAAAPAQTQEPPQPVWRTDVAGSRIEKAPLIGLVPGGQARSVRLSGLSRMQFFDFGVVEPIAESVAQECSGFGIYPIHIDPYRPVDVDG